MRQYFQPTEVCSWVIPSCSERGYLPFPDTPRPPAFSTPNSAKEFRRTSRILTCVTLWKWMIFKWEDFKDKLSAMGVAHQCILCCFPAIPMDPYRQWILSGNYCITEEVTKKISRWKNRINVKESIFDSFRLLIFTFSLYLKKHQSLQETKYWRLALMTVRIQDTNNQKGLLKTSFSTV